MKRAVVIPLAALILLGSLSVAAVPALVRIPIVKEHGKADPVEPGVFSHWQHDEFQCMSCHPSLFPQARRGFTHDEMDEGRFCGACHDGRTASPASGEKAACRATCHAR